MRKKGTILSVNFIDFASWYNKVKAEFDELAPEPISINIPTNGGTVTALCFETDRAPYVVKNPQGGTIQREVPWREATDIKSATRSHSNIKTCNPNRFFSIPPSHLFILYYVFISYI